MAHEAQGLGHLVGVLTEVHRHPVQSGWAVWAVVTGPLGSFAYASHQDFMLEESATTFMHDVVDEQIDAALRRESSKHDSGEFDPFDAMREVNSMERMDTQWRPGQFDSL